MAEHKSTAEWGRQKATERYAAADSQHVVPPGHKRKTFMEPHEKKVATDPEGSNPLQGIADFKESK